MLLCSIAPVDTQAAFTISKVAIISECHLRNMNNFKLEGEVATPLYRWVGGKRKLLPQILPLLPAEFGTYYEPFFGGGAAYFSLQHSRAVIGDKNPELINFLRVVKSGPGHLIKALSKLRNSESEYYRVRASKPDSEIQRAARFIYLTNLSFNGIYRVNKKGDFNVPYCKEPDRPFFDGAKIWACHRKLKETEIKLGNFAETVASAKSGDLVYFDPPYTVAHDNNGFLEYNEHIFQWDDQVKLAELAKQLNRKGVRVVISNANHDSVKKLYDTDKTHLIHRTSTVSGDGSKRVKVQEILVVYA